MEFLHGTMVIATLGGALIVIAVSVVIFYFLFQAIWPSLIGAGAVYSLWMYVDQFLGAICALMFSHLSIVVAFTHQGKRNPMHGYVPDKDKSKQRTQDLYLPGYLD